MSPVLSRLDDPYDGLVVIEPPLEADDLGPVPVVTGLRRDTVPRAHRHPNGTPQSGLAGPQAMIDAIEQLYCEAAVLMEALDASRRIE